MRAAVLLLLLPLVPVVLALMFSEPAVLALAAIGVTMVASERTITDASVIGLNVLDALVLMMIPVMFTRLSVVRQRLYRKNVAIALLLWALGGLALVGALTGQSVGYPLRSVLRDLRFYVYLIVTFHFAATLEMDDLKRLGVGWGLLAAVQILLIAVGRLIYNPDEAGTQVFGLYAFDSATHFLPVKSLAPLFLSLSLLIVAGRSLGRAARISLAIVVVFEIAIVAFSYSRSLYIASLVAVVAQIALSVQATGRGARMLAKVAAVCMAAVMLAVVFGFDWRGLPAVAAIENRFVSSSSGDNSILERTEGMTIALQRTLASPVIGSGLGTAGDYSAATEFHNSYLWMARSIGVPAAAMFVLALVLSGVSTWTALGRRLGDEVQRALWVGFATCFVSQVTIAAGQPGITNIIYLLEWGLLLGLLSSLAEQSGRRRATSWQGRRERGSGDAGV